MRTRQNRGLLIGYAFVEKKTGEAWAFKWVVTAKYGHSLLSERREQAIQAILLSFNHCHFLLQLRNFDTSIKKEQEAVKSLKQLQER